VEKTQTHTGRRACCNCDVHRKELKERWCGGPPSLVAPPTAGIYIVKFGFGSRVEEAVRRKSCVVCVVRRERSVKERKDSTANCSS
jgi:hypothetical protein